MSKRAADGPPNRSTQIRVVPPSPEVVDHHILAIMRSSQSPDRHASPKRAALPPKQRTTAPIITQPVNIATTTPMATPIATMPAVPAVPTVRISESFTQAAIEAKMIRQPPPRPESILEYPPTPLPCGQRGGGGSGRSRIPALPLVPLPSTWTMPLVSICIIITLITNY